MNIACEPKCIFKAGVGSCSIVHFLKVSDAIGIPVRNYRCASSHCANWITVSARTTATEKKEIDTSK